MPKYREGPLRGLKYQVGFHIQQYWLSIKVKGKFRIGIENVLKMLKYSEGAL